MKNLMKSTALVTALGFGTAAVADASFGFQTQVEDDSSIMIDLVRASEPGVLAIYDYSAGEFGDLLGTVEINAGANVDVIVPLDVNAANQLAAVVYEGEVSDPTMAAGWIELDVSDDS